MREIAEWIENKKEQFFDDRYRIIQKCAFNQCWADYKNNIAVMNEGRDPKQQIKEANANFFKSEWERLCNLIFPQKALYGLQAALTHNGTESAPIANQLIEAMTGKVQTLDVAAFCHWLWQVKRKIYGLPVVNHLFVMLYEPIGGSGKSTAVNKLLAPLGEYVLNWDLSRLSNENNLLALNDNYVVFFDEMAKPDRIDADNLKNQITTEANTVRLFHTQTSGYFKQNCSFIGASNKPLDTLIIDSTNMRRFFQLNCQEKMDWDFINKFDPVLLWQAIDENCEQGYLTEGIQGMLTAHQIELKTADVVEEFVVECNVKGDGKWFLTTDVLYYAFRCYCDRAGWKTIPQKNRFSKMLKTHFEDGGKCRWHRTKTERGFWVNSEAALELLEGDKG